ncbi:hypothetical protein [Pandoraea terrae]|uniref:hypothetical protein n=1 Tax=Pandoraea terrae TaxID=1537710 RepID=UPI001241FF47|nr:hypothetical protein [Pandoraea terrae]
MENTATPNNNKFVIILPMLGQRVFAQNPKKLMESKAHAYLRPFRRSLTGRRAATDGGHPCESLFHFAQLMIEKLRVYLQ